MADLLTFEYRVDGILTSTGVTSVTIGIVRVSDSAVVLAPGAATVNPSAGIYTYDPTALALSSSLAYTATWTYIDGDGSHAAVDTIEAEDTSRSLSAYRRALQYRLGRFQVATTTAASVSGTATRELICGTLADADGATTQYAGYYAAVASGVLAGQERILARTGFTAATGTLLTTRAYGDTPASGVEVELSNRLPATPLDGAEGVNAAINWALRRCYFRDRISFEPVEGQRFYSLLPHRHWLDSDLRIGQVFTAAVDAFSNPEPKQRGASIRLDAELPMLEIDVPFTATDTTFFVEVLRLGHTWIKSGGSWSESTVGLVADTDQALVDPDLLVEIALVHCYRQLMQFCEPGERNQWRAEYTEQAAHAVRARSSMLADFLEVKNTPKAAYPTLVW